MQASILSFRAITLTVGGFFLGHVLAELSDISRRILEDSNAGDMNSWCENAEVLNSTFAYLAEEERSHLGEILLYLEDVCTRRPESGVAEVQVTPRGEEPSSVAWEEDPYHALDDDPAGGHNDRQCVMFCYEDMKPISKCPAGPDGFVCRCWDFRWWAVTRECVAARCRPPDGKHRDNIRFYNRIMWGKCKKVPRPTPRLLPFHPPSETSGPPI